MPTDRAEFGGRTKQTSLVPPEQKIRAVLERAAEREYDYRIGFSSGGLDSLLAIKATLKYGPDYGIQLDAVAFWNTGTGLPSTTETVQRFCADHGLPYVEGMNKTRKEMVGPQYLDYGAPGPGEGRVMVDRKHATAYVLRKERVGDGMYSGFGGDLLCISGAYADESDQRNKKMTDGAIKFGETGKKKPRRTMVSPIYALTEDEVQDLAAEWDILKAPAYDTLGASGDCTGCSYSQAGRFGNLWTEAPNLAYCWATLMVWTQMRRARGQLNIPPERVIWGWGDLDEDSVQALRDEDTLFNEDADLGPVSHEMAATFDEEDVADDGEEYEPPRVDHDLQEFACADCKDRCDPAIPVGVATDGGGR